MEASKKGEYNSIRIGRKLTLSPHFLTDNPIKVTVAQIKLHKNMGILIFTLFLSQTSITP